MLLSVKFVKGINKYLVKEGLFKCFFVHGMIYTLCLFETESENTNDGIDDEEKDPEYNYLAEIEEMMDSDEELRNDRAVKISSQCIAYLLQHVACVMALLAPSLNFVFWKLRRNLVSTI